MSTTVDFAGSRLERTETNRAPIDDARASLPTAVTQTVASTSI